MENSQKMISNMHIIHIELLQKLLEKALDIVEIFALILPKPASIIQSYLKYLAGSKKRWKSRQNSSKNSSIKSTFLILPVMKLWKGKLE